MWAPLYVKLRLPGSTWLGVALRCPPCAGRISIPMVTGQKGPFSHGTGCLGAHRQGEGRGDPPGSRAGVLPPRPAPRMVQERPPGCCVTQRKARLCLLSCSSSSSSQLHGLPSGLGRQEANALLPACSPLSPQVSVTATTTGNGRNRSCLLFFSLLSRILQAGFTYPEPPREGWGAQELP